MIRQSSTTDNFQLSLNRFDQYCGPKHLSYYEQSMNTWQQDKKFIDVNWKTGKALEVLKSWLAPE